ncbi:PAS domain-containing sensor histidine kinase [Pseudodesulfovibrio sp. zrk46]|uniref:PAS domain-containing sensor histidine kinase n=1 Tax=Pseudodesulfovibrio sp. zrk46 TaxID=2725288 RepID=UPI00144A0C65|nr:PAS domain-containing sensor histidine kinase [Pseudodesulfovibrio sp. zrk46]QJB57181.1 PAS domain S-box protein [Pseudodesulfovibrio sp. zrk46]
MIWKKRRFIYLVLIMVALVVAVSFFNSYYMYQMSISEQRARLSELVGVQKNVIAEIGVRLWASTDIDEHGVIDLLVRSHSLFMEKDSKVEFIVAKREGGFISFLSLNGKAVPSDSPMAKIPFDSGLAIPMKHALLRQVGTIIADDYDTTEVLAAYNYVTLRNTTLGIVAKVDLEEVKAPFMEANIIVLGVGSFLTLIGVWLFLRISEPIIRALQQSEQQYRGLVENADSLIIRIDSNGNITYANNYAQNYFAVDSVVGIPMYQLFEEEVSTPSIFGIAEFLSERTSLNPTQIAKSKNEFAYVSWTVKLFESQTPELLCIGIDVTNEHLARQAQKESQERFRALAKAAPVGIVITDLMGNLMYANEKMQELTRASTVELAGVGWLQFIERGLRDEIIREWFTQNNIKQRYEFQLTNLKGDELWILGQIVDLENAHSETVGKLVALTDITRIKEADVARSRLTAAIEQAAEMIIITDLDGTISYVNPAFEQVSGYSKEEVLGKNPRILNSGEHKRDFYIGLWETLVADEIWTGRFINRRKNGERYTQESTIGPVKNDNGERIGYVGVARDISEQLVIEARLRQSQKLESIGELAAGIAHEINTPTQYVTSNLQFFEDSFAKYSGMIEKTQKLILLIKNRELGGSESEILEYAEKIIDDQEVEFLKEDLPNALQESESGLKRISEIVQSIKQLAHPGEVKKSFWSLNEIVRDAVTVATNEWKYSAIINYDLDEQLDHIYCLKAEVGQVILNVVVNAAHAIEAVRDIDDELGSISIKTYSERDLAVLEISDTGSGIPEELLDRIFDPFFTTKEVGKGTGQGLAIAHNVVTNLHNGSIEVLSTVGEGSTFVIKLPFEDKD